jgi:exodeoxyribonuclease-3
MKIFSWNVNGIRALQKKGALQYIFEKYSPDILCLQETKASEEQLDDEIKQIPGYHSFFESADKKGYSGVAIYSKLKPLYVKNMEVNIFDNEGRYIEAKFDNFILVNCYFPNSQEKGKRLDYKLKFCEHILEKCNSLIKNGENIILCGDYNIAHQEIDLKNPKTNTKNPGFLPEERAWMSEFLNSKYIDVFRYLYPDEIKYTWWSYRFRAREKNIGWRIDYHCVNEAFISHVKNIEILDSIIGSDHCPVSIELK